MYYLDTSIVAAFYLPETASPRVQAFYSRAGRAVISALSEVEFHSALSRRVRMKELSREDARRALAQFRAHVLEGLYELAPLNAHEYLLARDWLGGFDSPLRTLDALHLAVSCSNGLTLVTADNDLAHCAGRLGVKRHRTA